MILTGDKKLRRMTSKNASSSLLRLDKEVDLAKFIII
jgi:hypothetical protein